MKFNCPESLTVEGLIRQRATWQRWFAWFPVRTGQYECRWLETVERRDTCAAEIVAMLDKYSVPSSGMRVNTPNTFLELFPAEWEYRERP